MLDDNSSAGPAYESVDATEIILDFFPYRISNDDNISVIGSNTGDSNTDTSQSSEHASSDTNNGNDNGSIEGNVNERVEARYKDFKVFSEDLKEFSRDTENSDIVLTYFNVLLWDLLKYSEHRNSLEKTKADNIQNTQSNSRLGPENA